MFQGILRRLVLAGTAGATGLFLLSGAAFAQGAAPPAATQHLSHQHVCNWGHRVWGVPESFHAGAKDGYYIWCGPSDDGRTDRELHLRTTDRAGVHHYAGTLRTNGTFRDVEKVRDEPDDHVEVVKGGHEIKYSFLTAEGIDGFNFNVAGGTRVHLALDEGGKPISTTSIYLGKESKNPKHNPFSIRRLGERHHHGDGGQSHPTSANASPQPGAAAS